MNPSYIPPPASPYAQAAPVYHPGTTQPVHQHHTPMPAVQHQRSEADAQWIVGWIRDILVIAMSVANLLHLAAHGG